MDRVERVSVGAGKKKFMIKVWIRVFRSRFLDISCQIRITPSFLNDVKMMIKWHMKHAHKNHKGIVYVRMRSPKNNSKKHCKYIIFKMKSKLRNQEVSATDTQLLYDDYMSLCYYINQNTKWRSLSSELLFDKNCSIRLFLKCLLFRNIAPWWLLPWCHRLRSPELWH